MERKFRESFEALRCGLSTVYSCNKICNAYAFGKVSPGWDCDLTLALSNLDAGDLLHVSELLFCADIAFAGRVLSSRWLCEGM